MHMLIFRSGWWKSVLSQTGSGCTGGRHPCTVGRWQLYRCDGDFFCDPVCDRVCCPYDGMGYHTQERTFSLGRQREGISPPRRPAPARVWPVPEWKCGVGTFVYWRKYTIRNNTEMYVTGDKAKVQKGHRSWKNGGGIIRRCDIIKGMIWCVYQEFLEENETWINFRSKPENLKSFKSFFRKREAYGWF